MSAPDDETAEGGMPRMPTGRDVLRYLPGAFVRVVVPSVVIVVLFCLPFAEVIQPDRLALVEGVFIAVCMAGFLLFFRWQVHTVHSSETPETRWLEALVLVAVLFVSVFARVYRVTSLSAPDAFGMPLTMTEAYFYALGTLTTAGTGDVIAKGDFAKAVTMVQMIANLAFIGVVVRVLTSAGRTAVQRRRAETASRPSQD